MDREAVTHWENDRGPSGALGGGSKLELSCDGTTVREGIVMQKLTIYPWLMWGSNAQISL